MVVGFLPARNPRHAMRTRTHVVACSTCGFRRSFSYSDNAATSAAIHAEDRGHETTITWWAHYRFHRKTIKPKAPAILCQAQPRLPFGER